MISIPEQHQHHGYHVQPRPTTLIQISDCHLFARPDKTMAGINTYQSFIDVLALIRHQEQQVDHIILTGDISQDDSLASYHTCHQLLTELNIPFTWLRGNHDDMDPATSIIYQNNFSSLVEIGVWRVIVLNSQVKGQIYGEISDQDLLTLEQTLKHSHQPVLIALHHPPCAMDSLWLDGIGLKNGARLLAILKQYPQVQAIIHGHAHQARDIHHDQLRILGVPSTCLQFTPNQPTFHLDDQQPGYRRLRLFADGNLETEVFRLPNNIWLPDRTSAAY